MIDVGLPALRLVRGAGGGGRRDAGEMTFFGCLTSLTSAVLFFNAVLMACISRSRGVFMTAVNVSTRPGILLANKLSTEQYCNATSVCSQINVYPGKSGLLQVKLEMRTPSCNPGSCADPRLASKMIQDFDVDLRCRSNEDPQASTQIRTR